MNTDFLKDYAELYHGNDTFVICDTESTNFTPNDIYGKLIEIAAIKVKKDQIIDTFKTYINPKIKIPKKIVELTNIDDEKVKDAPSYEEALNNFYQFTENDNCVLIFHNATHDLHFLNYFGNKQGLTFGNKTIDTLKLAKITYPDFKSYKLENLCKELDIEDTNHHEALNDVKVTYELFKKIVDLKILDNIDKPIIKNKTKQSKIKFDCDVKKCNYWEKDLGKTKLKRVYIMIRTNHDYANIFFDLNKEEWGIKDSSYNNPINFKIVEKKIKDKYDLKGEKFADGIRERFN